MAKYIICLDKDDICVSQTGLHYSIATTDGITINFTPEAFAELQNDINSFLPTQSPLSGTSNKKYIVRKARAMYYQTVGIFDTLQQVHKFLDEAYSYPYEQFVGESENEDTATIEDWYNELEVEIEEILL